MRLAVTVLTGWLALAWAAPAAEKKVPPGPADLLPANVTAYMEVQKLGTLAKEIRALFKGSALYNVPDSLAEMEARYPDWPSYRMEPLKVMSMFLSPEVINEIAKCQGAAGAFLGISSDKGGPQPEYVFIVQPGTSNAPTALMRMTLTMAPVKAKETVEGVKIYRAYSRVYPERKVGPDGKVGAPPPEVREHDPSLAMMKDYLLIGSHKAVKDCILRAKGKVEGDTLAQDKEFQAAQKKVGGEPGLFFYAKVSSLTDLLTQMTKGAPPEVTRILEAYVAAINPKAFRSSALSLSLQKGTLHYHDIALLDPKEKSPLLEVVPSKTVKTDLLHFAPADAVMAVALSNGDGAQRWDKLVKTLDELVPPATWGGNRFSQLIEGVEKKLGVQLGPDIIGKTTNIGFALGNPLNAPFVVTRTDNGAGNVDESGQAQVPMVVILETADEKAAGAMVDLVVKVARLAAGKEVKPEKKTIKGQDISSITLNAHYSLAYGRVGNTVVVGPYAEGVAQALADGTNKKGLAADEKFMAQIKEFKDPIGVTMIKPGTLLFSSVALTGYSTRSKPARAVPPEGKEPPAKLEQPGQPKTTVTVRPDSPEVAKMKKELMEVLALEPWLAIGVMRGEDFLTREGKSPGWDKFVPKVVDYGVQKLMEQSSKSAKPPAFDPGQIKIKPKEEIKKE
jgi:hypothetical protein